VGRGAGGLPAQAVGGAGRGQTGAGDRDGCPAGFRSREEYDAVQITGSILMSQPTMQEILGKWQPNEIFVIIDHVGKQGLDAAAYFLGHGFENVRCLRGGIDAWSQEIDPKLSRYRLG
jgi:rhodanese-related sulfurtransferase